MSAFPPIAVVDAKRHLAQVTSYVDLDPIIDKWVEATSSTLFDDWDGKPTRCFHVGGDSPFECFQIVVFPPGEGSVTVQAASIDTNDDAEMIQIWEGPVSTLDDMLAVAVATVDQWKRRERKTPDPPSPW